MSICQPPFSLFQIKKCGRHLSASVVKKGSHLTINKHREKKAEAWMTKTSLTKRWHFTRKESQIKWNGTKTSLIYSNVCRGYSLWSNLTYWRWCHDFCCRSMGRIFSKTFWLAHISLVLFFNEIVIDCGDCVPLPIVETTRILRVFLKSGTRSHIHDKIVIPRKWCHLTTAHIPHCFRKYVV